MKNRKSCKKCNRPYRQHIKGKPYCIGHLRAMGIWEYPREKMTKEEKELYIFYPRFMWEEKNRYIHKLVKDTMAEMKGE